MATPSKQHKPKPNYGKLEVKFSDDISDFKCQLCQRVTKQAVQTSCCGKNFCEECIQDTSKQGKACPTCKQAPFTYFPDKKQQRKVNDLKVACIGKLCKWSGTLGDYIDHLDTCLHVKMNCPFCSKKILRKTIDKHKEESCQNRPYTCPYCKTYKDTYQSVQKHIPVCEFAPRSCPYKCGVEDVIGEQAMRQHLGTCPKQPVDCEYKRFGCNESVTRDTIQLHKEQQIHKHLEMVVQQLGQAPKAAEGTNNTKLEAKIKKLEAKVDSISAEVEIIASFILVLPVSFTIERYSSFEGTGRQWNDIPSLYTHQKGYKLKVAVRFEQDGLYVDVVHTSGSNDSHLPWPLEFTLNVTILNQADTTTNISRSFKVVMNKGQKCSTFIATYPHIRIATSAITYLQSDSLQLRISVERIKPVDKTENTSSISD